MPIPKGVRGGKQNLYNYEKETIYIFACSNGKCKHVTCRNLFWKM